MEITYESLLYLKGSIFWEADLCANYKTSFGMCPTGNNMHASENYKNLKHYRIGGTDLIQPLPQALV